MLDESKVILAMPWVMTMLISFLCTIDSELADTCLDVLLYMMSYLAAFTKFIKCESKKAKMKILFNGIYNRMRE